MTPPESLDPYPDHPAKASKAKRANGSPRNRRVGHPACIRLLADRLSTSWWLPQQVVRKLGGESLSSDDREQLEFFVTFASWGGVEDEQGLILVRGEKELAVELNIAQIVMDERLVATRVGLNFVLVPDRLEVRALLEKLGHDGRTLAVRVASGQGSSEGRHHGSALALAVRLGVDGAFCGVGKPAVYDASGRTGELGLIPSRATARRFWTRVSPRSDIT